MIYSFDYLKTVKNISLWTLAFAFILSIASCGGSSSTSTRTPAEIAATTTETRTALGTASGDISRVGTLNAQRTSDGQIYQATISQSARINALSGTAFSFSVDIPTGFSYNFNFLNGAGQAIAQIAVSNSIGGTTTNVPVNQGSTDISFGNITFPQGSGENYENDDPNDDEAFEIEGDHDPVESGETGEIETSGDSGGSGSGDSGGGDSGNSGGGDSGNSGGGDSGE